jgi:hypothetical protein
MQHSAESIFIIEYLREYEFIFEKAHESGGPGVLIDEKTEGRKSRDTVPLKIFSFFTLLINHCQVLLNNEVMTFCNTILLFEFYEIEKQFKIH